MNAQIIPFPEGGKRGRTFTPPLAESSTRRGDPDWASMPDKRLISVANYMVRKSVPLPLDLSTELAVRGFTIPR
jgi:hypothetical protein